MPENQKPCRLCLKYSINFATLNEKLVNIIKILFDIHISSHSGSHDIPSEVCLDCTKIVTEFYDYYVTVKSNQAKLLHSHFVVVENETVVIKKEDLSSESEHEPEPEPIQSDQSDTNDSDDNLKTDLINLNPKIEIIEGNFDVKTPEIHLKEYYCDICGGNFSTKVYLKKHILRQHLYINNVGCDICGKRLYDSSSLKRHIDAVHNHIKQPNKRRACPHCGKIISNLASHLKYKHKEIAFSDQDNKSSRGRKRTVKRHIKEHHQNIRVPPKRSICTKCGKNVTAIQLHMRRVHNSNKPEAKPKKELPKVECPICKKLISSRQDNINEHKRRVHGMIIPKKEKQRKSIKVSKKE
uniref:CSON010370 protein n=1 Tax=Culicoides sonorensis TaxID=179676 RepID=A0A336K356_CULSO